MYFGGRLTYDAAGLEQRFMQLKRSGSIDRAGFMGAVNASKLATVGIFRV